MRVLAKCSTHKTGAALSESVFFPHAVWLAPSVRVSGYQAKLNALGQLLPRLEQLSALCDAHTEAQTRIHTLVGEEEAGGAPGQEEGEGSAGERVTAGLESFATELQSLRNEMAFNVQSVTEIALEEGERGERRRGRSVGVAAKKKERGEKSERERDGPLLTEGKEKDGAFGFDRFTAGASLLCVYFYHMHMHAFIYMSLTLTLNLTHSHSGLYKFAKNANRSFNSILPSKLSPTNAKNYLRYALCYIPST
jgi:hypothetical protein